MKFNKSALKNHIDAPQTLILVYRSKNWIPLSSLIIFTSRTWCLKQRGRKSGTWWHERSSDSAPQSRRCAAAPFLWVRSWITYRRTWTPCRLNWTLGGGRTKSTHRPCCRSRGKVDTYTTCFTLRVEEYDLLSAPVNVLIHFLNAWVQPFFYMQWFQYFTSTFCDTCVNVFADHCGQFLDIFFNLIACRQLIIPSPFCFMCHRATDKAVEPLKVELAELEQLIKDQQDKICAVRSNILKNEEKIQKMVTGINFSSRTWNENQGARWQNFAKNALKIRGCFSIRTMVRPFSMEVIRDGTKRCTFKGEGPRHVGLGQSDVGK